MNILKRKGKDSWKRKPDISQKEKEDCIGIGGFRTKIKDGEPVDVREGSGVLVGETKGELYVRFNGKTKDGYFVRGDFVIEYEINKNALRTDINKRELESRLRYKLNANAVPYLGEFCKNELELLAKKEEIEAVFQGKVASTLMRNGLSLADSPYVAWRFSKKPFKDDDEAKLKLWLEDYLTEHPVEIIEEEIAEEDVRSLSAKIPMEQSYEREAFKEINRICRERRRLDRSGGRKDLTDYITAEEAGKIMKAAYEKEFGK